MALPRLPDPTVPDHRHGPSIGASGDVRGDWPVPRVVGDILIGLLVIIIVGAVIFLIVSAPPVLPAAAFVLMCLWIVGMFTRWTYEEMNAPESNRPPPPPPDA